VRTVPRSMPRGPVPPGGRRRFNRIFACPIDDHECRHALEASQAHATVAASRSCRC
jgi:hypothetical protein